MKKYYLAVLAITSTYLNAISINFFWRALGHKVAYTKSELWSGIFASEEQQAKFRRYNSKLAKKYGHRDFKNAFLTRINFFAVNFAASNFTQANLAESDFTHANLTNADFTDACLQWANLSNANLFWTDFTNADLRNTNLKDAEIGDSYFSETNFSNAMRYDDPEQNRDWLTVMMGLGAKNSQD